MKNRGSPISQAISGEFEKYERVPENIALLIKEGKK
jgi:hypothetical protein